MGYASENLFRTLILQRGKKSGREVYVVHPMMRVRTDVGEGYMEPVPYEFFVQGSKDRYFFDEIEVIDPPGDTRDDTAGEVHLNKFAADYAVRRT